MVVTTHKKDSKKADARAPAGSWSPEVPDSKEVKVAGIKWNCDDLELVKVKDESLFIPLTEVDSLVADHPTPFHLYDEGSIRKRCQTFREAFGWSTSDVVNYFAVKATPNREILKILIEEGFGADCSSIAELHLSKSLGCRHIMFTSNNTSLEAFKIAKDYGAIINFDDINHLKLVDEKLGLPELVSFRYNPGTKRHGCNDIIGLPTESKFGVRDDQFLEAYAEAQRRGVKRFGAHTMVMSNSLDSAEFVMTARMMFILAADLFERHQIKLEFINLGGGVGIPYRPTDCAVDLVKVGAQIKELFSEHLSSNMYNQEQANLKIMCECGRWVTGPAGCLITRVINQKDSYRAYIGVDACMADLMRPAMYSTYHHVRVIRSAYGARLPNLPNCKDVFSTNHDEPFKCDVVGNLCENNDKFCIDRHLHIRPLIGDLIVIYDSGAHGHSMGFNYNGRPRSAEYLRQLDGSLRLIRRPETHEDILRTLVWEGDDQSDDCAVGSVNCRLYAWAAVGAAVAIGLATLARRHMS